MIKENSSIEGASYGKQVVVSIINLATLEIAGVSSMHQKGVKARFNGNTIDIDVFINILSGHTVSDVAFRVQENIKRGIETMTLYKANTINVYIMGINFDKIDGSA